MRPFFVPWQSRSRKPLSGPAGAAARVAVGVRNLAAPLLARFPGAIFLLAVIATCLLVWVTALLCRAATSVQGPRLRSVSELDQALQAAGNAMPGWAVWPLQFLVLRDLLALGGIVGFVSVLAMFAIWWERKVSARIQSRLGPMRVGGWHGWSQSLADGLKLLCKEDLAPAGADRVLFRLAPYFSFVPALAAFFVLPFGVSWAFRDLDAALLLVLALLGLDILGVLLAGWASNNKWSVYGAMREACQVISYEIPMGLSLLVPIMVVGSLRLTEFAEHQAGGWFNWLAWHSPWTFIATLTYFTASLAACKRAPFDLPEAESELVAGYHTEYSGFRWSLFFFAEYAAMFIVSGVLVILFLGAWDSPLAGLMPAEWQQDTSLHTQLLVGVLFSGPLWFVAKCMFLVYVQMWLRWTLPRLRIDQVLYVGVQVLLPLALLLVLASAAWELLTSRGDWLSVLAGWLRAVLATLGAVGVAWFLLVSAGGFQRRTELPGTLAVRRPLRGG